MTAPSIGVVQHRRIYKRHVASVATDLGAEAGVDLIHAAPHSDCPMLLDLVRQSVGERLDRVGGSDPVPVVVDQGVELAQACLTVARQDSERSRSEGSAPQELGVGDQRWNGWLVVGRRSPALLPRQDWPERVAELCGLDEMCTTLTGEVQQAAVEHRHTGEQFIAMHLEPPPLDRWDAAPPAAGAEASTKRMVA